MSGPASPVTDPAYAGRALAAGAFLRVVNWHNTPESGRDALRAQLAAYAREYVCVGPDDLDRVVATGRWDLPKPGIVLAFFDGYANNATVAAPLVDELGLRAWFHPPTSFLDVPPEQQVAYADAHDIDLLAEERRADRVAMTWDELADIATRHVVCAHTANHVALDEVLDEDAVEREVREPVRRLTALTGRVPPSFAFLYGRPFDAASPAWRAAAGLGVRYALSNTGVERIA
ncbi:polysaccharide deacetylase family protein [Aquipuribacter sp. SD81]|uniref:polysaccharide deacetylase family protein n=1 Tax=Aquipuribacter sp. SD81 TaxID=3127703 RepID=UPI00301AB1ED